MDALDELLHQPYPSAFVTTGGVIRRLNAAMATVLGRTAEQCAGRDFAELLPSGQRVSAERLVAQGATGKRLAMNVLEFPGPGSASLVFLVEAKLVEESESDERLVWVHSLGAENDLASLLIPFRLAAKAAGLGVWMYSPSDRQLEWMGGAPAMAALFPKAAMPLSWAMRRVHPDDQKALRRLLRPTTAQSPWIEIRFHTVHDDWHDLVCQARRIDIGYGGPQLTFGVVRDETEQKTQKTDMQAALVAEQERAGLIADFSSALITATTEQGLQQVVLTRLATTFEGTGAVLALVEDNSLHVSTDAGVSTEEADALHGMSLGDPDPLPVAIRTGEPQLIGSQEDYLQHWPHGAALSWFDLPDSGRAALVTPLGRADDQPLGAWAVIFDRDYQPSPDELALMGTLANLAGQALGRVKSQQVHLELAKAVQQSMLPTLPEHLPGLEVAARYRPSRDGLDIGGDWYDAYVLPDSAVAVEIGDIQGHDVDAAAFMGQVRASMRAIAADEPAPGTVLSRTNELLVTMGAARFATCTMLHIDPRDGRVTGTSAGHVPLLCVHARMAGMRYSISPATWSWGFFLTPTTPRRPSRWTTTARWSWSRTGWSKDRD
ncbi:SpoIIE family protein phosphatase [Streptomyces cocklensis]|uniref:PAS fold-containing protein n=1 Tax=Actinacidiphila cocklensis TaxID=887465 RepID=A0A9W4GUE1_9ACTN|nr:SpoIIE family protein phosphatase [Actinacidiphila cocklensis]MDD1061422.1 SpoIIE family protein phosphatase [Actinacidiphila cocklensis]CAG6397436.1 PAS fold-containing protein [Actinacidiphila cocklensis]